MSAANFTMKLKYETLEGNQILISDAIVASTRYPVYKDRAAFANDIKDGNGDGYIARIDHAGEPDDDALVGFLKFTADKKIQDMFVFQPYNGLFLYDLMIQYFCGEQLSEGHEIEVHETSNNENLFAIFSGAARRCESRRQPIPN